MAKFLTVTEITNYIKGVLSNDFLLGDVWVKGEISNFKHHYTGHMYFTLKDDRAVLKCVMFKGNNERLKFEPKDGLSVLARGNISVFEKNGEYQLYTIDMQPEGIGSLHLAFQQMKEKLEKEGLFDPAKKKAIPYLPDTICIVTSSTGSVIRDIVNVLTRRFPNIHMRLLPVAVQGELAAPQIVCAIETINRLDLGDVIILARGGGSLEDLWPFNEERVARAIFASEIPIISAVGHETDFTIADLVADKRAPTPSAAAELAVPERDKLTDNIYSYRIRLKRALQRHLDKQKQKLKTAVASGVFKKPFSRVNDERIKLDNIANRILREMQVIKCSNIDRFNSALNKLQLVNPLKVLSRGFSVVNSAVDGKLIKTVKSLFPGDKIRITMQDGKAGCTVNEVSEDEQYGKS